MLQQVPSPSAKEPSPATIERYEGETRESFLDREDRLTFRVDDGNVECRFYGNGRVDSVKEVTENRKDRRLHVVFAQRSDHCVALTVSANQQGSGWLYDASFTDRDDGVKSIHLATKDRAIDVTCDSSTTLIRHQLGHIAIKLDPEISEGKLLEVYQDTESRALRLVAQADDYGHRTTTTFCNDVPTNDPRYEGGKVMIMNAIHRIVLIQRELFLNLMPYVPHQDNVGLAAAQKERLYQLAGSLFAAYDDACGVTA